MTSTGNRTLVAHMVAQWFAHYATAALKLHLLYSLRFMRQEMKHKKKSNASIVSGQY